ncbi:MAG: hypothetical protein KJZ86_20410 [Caldilineaceae bacterium]|nr:hypothetical protein [Caldilineaceae bacterium]HRJ42679.1 hypothetical protein [Caldilineaceae bacterium]
MPYLTRLFIKSALAYFLAALLAGLLLAARPVLDLPPIVSGLGPVYFHLLMVGWVTQLILGVAHWMFPKFSQTQPRGREWLTWTIYGLLNGGLLLRILAEPARTVSAAPVWGWLLALSALLQWLAGMAFVAQLWPRVKER